MVDGGMLMGTLGGRDLLSNDPILVYIISVT
jgi:hypothetical protein